MRKIERYHAIFRTSPGVSHTLRSWMRRIRSRGGRITTRNTVIFLAAISAGALTFSTGPACAEVFPEVVMVTHPGIEIESVEREELSRLFLALNNRVGDFRLKAVNLSDHELKIGFLKKVTGMSENQIEYHFVQAELRGEGKWPPEVSNVEELVRLIVKSRNVIGWIPVSSLEALSDQYRNAVKVISIDGRKPGEDGYLFGPSGKF